jgi:phosphatidylinositol alpha-mannosyltransferase
MVSDLYLPEPGGIAEHIYHLSQRLRDQGHQIHVLTAGLPNGARGASGDRAPDEKFVHRVGRGLPIPVNRSMSRIAIGYRVGKQVRELLEAERYDIVHIHGSLAPTLPLAALKQSHSINVATFHAGHERSAGYRVFHSYLRGYFRRLHGLIAVSETARRAMDEYFPGDYRIIPNGVDTDFFRPDVKPAHELGRRRPRILFVGRFEPRKGLTYLLDALPMIRAAVPEVQCIVVGSGPRGVEKYRRKLNEDMADAVIFTGTIPGKARPHYYASCDVFCAPSTGNESFGIILLEAMATGKPIVASDIEGYRDVLTHGVEGLLVPPKDETALARAIVEILKLSPARRRRMGAAGRAKALKYSWPRVADRVEAFYRGLARQFKGRLPDYDA